jgi:ABC-type dipeptide/oligopeptide/nickel transport system ATPase subunit
MLIETRNLRKVYPRVTALKGLSLALDEGQTLGLVGESGSGKSTLARLLAGLLEPTSGEILWKGRPLGSLSRRERAGCVQMVFQDPSSSLNPKLRMGTQLDEALAVRAGLDGLSLNVTRRRGDLLASVGMPADAGNHYPHEFSGGQKQRLAIARSLALRPRLLVADEPVSALDLSIQAQILNLFMELQERENLALLFVSHDLTVVGRLTRRIIVLKDGESVEEGDSEELLSHPRHPHTQNLLNSVPGFLRA